MVKDVNRVRVYLASGWFTDNTREILGNLEGILSNRSDIDLYSPRRDGIMLPPDQKHDTALRESIFQENISNILKSDLVFANIDSQDSYNDPGTVYEVGYAMAHGVPVVGFATSEDNIKDRFKGILDGFECVLLGYDTIAEFFEEYGSTSEEVPAKVLFVGAGNSTVDAKLATHIMDNGANLRWVNEMHADLYSRIDEVFENVEYMIVVVDDRKTLPSWMIGQAYARQIPVVTYSDYGYGINVMLLCSVLTHIRGTDELDAFMQKVKREGLESIPKFDISQLNSM